MAASTAMFVCPHSPNTWRTPRRSRYPTSCSAAVGGDVMRGPRCDRAASGAVDGRGPDHGRQLPVVGAVVGVVDRVDTPHRRHRPQLLVGVRQDPGEARGDEHGVAEVAGEADLAEDRRHGAVDVDRHRPADRPGQRRLDGLGGGEVLDRPSPPRGRRRRVGRAGGRGRGAGGDRTRAPGGPAIGWWPPADRRRRRGSSPPAAASTTEPMASIDDSTAAPWCSPRASRPAAAPAWRVAPPEMAVRAASTDGAPAPWSMLATITASISRAVEGSGRSPV